VPGVLSVAETSQMPLSRSGNYTGLAADRKQAQYCAGQLLRRFADQTWGLQLVEGRDFLPNEVPEIDPTPATTSPSGIVTRALAEKMWPGQSSYVGKTVYFGTGEKARARKWSWSSACRRQARRSARRRVLDHARPPDRHEVTHYTLRAEPGQRDRVMKEAEAIRAASPGPVVTHPRRERVPRRPLSRRQRAGVDAGHGQRAAVADHRQRHRRHGQPVGHAAPQADRRAPRAGARRIDILRYFMTENFMITSAGVAAGVLIALA
jgi:putative ABC transport system permease protein